MRLASALFVGAISALVPTQIARRSTFPTASSSRRYGSPARIGRSISPAIRPTGGAFLVPLSHAEKPVQALNAVSR